MFGYVFKQTFCVYTKVINVGSVDKYLQTRCRGYQWIFCASAQTNDHSKTASIKAKMANQLYDLSFLDNSGFKLLYARNNSVSPISNHIS